MSLFRRQKPANDAGSTSVPTAGNFVGVFGSWLSRKGQKAQPNVGSIPSSAADSPAQRGRHDGPTDREEVGIAQSLWDRAYTALRTKDARLVKKYEELLSMELRKTSVYKM
jgi:hypothetical protein